MRHRPCCNKPRRIKLQHVKLTIVSFLSATNGSPYVTPCIWRKYTLPLFPEGVVQNINGPLLYTECYKTDAISRSNHIARLNSIDAIQLYYTFSSAYMRIHMRPFYIFCYIKLIRIILGMLFDDNIALVYYEPVHGNILS